ncbi:hypothetical protein Tco_1402781, partial [Tanacetum coccineum]
SSQYVQRYYSIVEYSATWAPESHSLMKHIGRNHLSHCSQVLILNEKEEVALVQQGFEMEWTLKKEEKLAFPGFVRKVVIVRKNVLLGLEKDPWSRD